jgi:CDP-glycerol glycerophosphotransferase (TagB/SpsB family)|tara:strand:- start:237 stop:1274 length:1038 start_codon:yes stop_codon:yes gene_type:complete
MKVVLFCKNPYSFGILKSIKDELVERNYDYLWFVCASIVDRFPYDDEKVTSDMKELISFKADVIFVPGNEVPHYLRGLKIQVFHGLAAEKKRYFRIRDYFDLYFTPGPFYTNRFKKLSEKHKNFEVVETGWCKLDVFGKDAKKYENEKQQLLEKHQAKKIVLYAPTFSPAFTSAPYLYKEIKRLSEDDNYLILIKFHDLMPVELIDKYKKLAVFNDAILFQSEKDVIKFLLMADILVSDTSSVVYEFLFLDKPAITFKNNSKIIKWDDSLEYNHLVEKVTSNLEEDSFKSLRKEVYSDYHPYNDGKSAVRMIDAALVYLEENEVPESRKLSWLRRRKMNKMFGKY